MMTQLSRRRGLAALCLGVAPFASAASDTTSSEAVSSTAAPVASDTAASEQMLNPMVVTATLAPRTADQSLASVTVIDEAELRRQDPKDITDILRAQPGVDVTSNGGYGKTSNVNIRGAGGESTLLLIDGIRLRSATAGSPAWQLLEPRMFERVEVVRGPRGSLYGADAVGGVVQLFTREGKDEGPHPSITAGGGSFGTERYGASLTGRADDTRYAFSASHLSTDGTEIKRGDGDKGYDNTTGFVRLSQGFDNGGEVGLLGLRARGNSEYVGGNTDYVQQVAGLYGELPVTERWTSRVTLSEARDESDDDANGSLTHFDTVTHSARWENTLMLGPHDLIAGAEYSQDKIDSSSDYSEDSRDNAALFAQALLDFSPLSLQAGVRFDDNEAFGEEVTGHLGMSYALDRVHTLRASYGTAFRAPTFNELYFPGFGNDDLDPERSRTAELGLRGQFGKGFWDLSVYRTEIDDMIANTSRNGRFAPFNVNHARIRGVELATGADVRDWTLRAALTYTDPEDQDTGNRLVRRASRSLRLDADRALGDWTLGGSFIAQNHRYNDVDNEERLPGFGLVNLRAGWQFAPLWSAQMTLENVLDKEYATARASAFQGGWDYLNPGRAAFLSVRFGE
ncbi:vitamin B12 transporter [Onishia taeanensis]|uniref:Vitamin B12 transporter n=2 Tax=Onishia taeanensis TaxID=284577 RepID=A0A328XYR9_9GAMM|nr:TonB-dependent receptor [Halomonas taeanensis]RAR64659.1 vitamin B12 transporter [Halomonas taeanensis]